MAPMWKDVSPRELALLEVLRVKGPSLIREVMDAMKLGRPTASAMLHRLCSRGLLTTREHPGNCTHGRTDYLLTDRGRAQLATPTPIELPDPTPIAPPDPPCVLDVNATPLEQAAAMCGALAPRLRSALLLVGAHVQFAPCALGARSADSHGTACTRPCCFSS